MISVVLRLRARLYSALPALYSSHSNAQDAQQAYTSASGTHRHRWWQCTHYSSSTPDNAALTPGHAAASEPETSRPANISGLVERLRNLANEHSTDDTAGLDASPKAVEEFSMEYFRAQEAVDTTKLRTSIFEDIGVPQQAAWYEVATGEPLLHEKSRTCIYVHSVNRFQAASIETARAMIMLLRPSVLAVQLHNDMAHDLIPAAQARLAMVRSEDHVRQIADGYQRVCLGVSDTSDLNPNAAALHQSYAEGQELARLHQMEDYETVLEELARFPSELEDFKQRVQDKLLFRDIWHSMFLSGMTPWEHIDRHIVDSAKAGRKVELVDVPRQRLAQLAQEVMGENLNEEADRQEAQGFFDLLVEHGKKTMPINLPEQVWHIMSPAALYPGDMPEFYQKINEVAPYTFELMKFRAAYTTRALDTLAAECPQGVNPDERNIVCLVDRMVEPLIRLQWEELQQESDKDAQVESLVHDLPFIPKPLDRANRRAKKRTRKPA